MALTEEVNLIEKLKDETTYQLWKFQIVVTFKAYDLFGIVNGDKLLSSVEKEEDKTKWVRNDAKAQKLIVTSIDKKYMMHIMDCTTSKEMFEKIKNIFERSTSEQICNLLQEFYSYTFGKGTDMATHISKIESIAHKLKSLNQTVDDNMLMSKILSSLPQSYGFFRTAWESTQDNEKTLPKLIARLLSEENRSKESERDIAFKSSERFCKHCKSSSHDTRFCRKWKEKGAGEVKCFKCGCFGHIANNCPKKTNNQCKICKKTNHKEQDCFFRDKTKSLEKKKIAFLTEDRRLTTQDFIVDSGCSSHMVNSKVMFTALENIESSIQVARKVRKRVILQKILQ